MTNLKQTKFTVNSDEVKNAKVSKKNFVTTVFESTLVNGSKYKPGHWRDDMYEVETSDGVFISISDLSEYKNQKIVVRSNVNIAKGMINSIGWIWLNFVSVKDPPLVSVKDEPSEPKFYEIQEALSLNVPNTICFVYKIEFGNECYVGFTTQKPSQRLQKHISIAQDGGMQKISKAFRKWGFIYDYEIINEYQNEIEGLVSEIRNIEKFECSLNESIGGQGKDFDIVPHKNKFNENIFTVHDKNNVLAAC